jgi:hypothetical protein
MRAQIEETQKRRWLRHVTFKLGQAGTVTRRCSSGRHGSEKSVAFGLLRVNQLADLRLYGFIMIRIRNKSNWSVSVLLVPTLRLAGRVLKL